MKCSGLLHRSLFVLLLFVFSSGVYAQVKVESDNSVKIGNAVKIDTSGKTGIGTLTPSHQLHVVSDNPLRLEGLVQKDTLEHVLGADASGVVYKIPLTSLTGISAGEDEPFTLADLQQNDTLAHVLGTDSSGVVFKIPTSRLSGGWYKKGTQEAPTSIIEDIYRHGNVTIGPEQNGAIDLSYYEFGIAYEDYVNSQLYVKNTNRPVSMVNSLVRNPSLTATRSSGQTTIGLINNVVDHERSFATGIWNTSIHHGDYSRLYGIYNITEGKGSNMLDLTGISNSVRAIGNKSSSRVCGIVNNLNIESGFQVNSSEGYSAVRNIISKSSEGNAYGTNTDITINPDGALGGTFGLGVSIRKGTGDFTVDPGVAGVYVQLDANLVDAPSSYAGIFIGKVGSSVGFITESDKNLKEDISDITETGLSKIKQLKPKRYKLKNKERKSRRTAKNHFGFLAQDIQRVFPELVEHVSHPITKVDPTDPQKTITEYEDRLGVNYIELIPFLVKAIQEQDEKIEQLERLIGKSAAPNITTHSDGTFLYVDRTRDTNEELILTLYDSNARSQQTQKWSSGNTKINTKKLSPGIYFLSVEDRNGTLLFEDTVLLK